MNENVARYSQELREQKNYLYENKTGMDAAEKASIKQSPNKVFSDYIFNVLPELDEDTIPEMEIETLAKGLEFDRVIAPRVDNDNYETEVDRSMLYIACTRAMHRLTLTHSSEPNRLIREPS